MRSLDGACAVHSAEKRAVPSSDTDTNDARHSSDSPRLSVVRNSTYSPIPTGKRKVQFSPLGRKRTTTSRLSGEIRSKENVSPPSAPRETIDVRVTANVSSALQAHVSATIRTRDKRNA